MALKLGNLAFGKKGYLGIDLGSSAIKVAEVEGYPPVLRSFGQVKLPEGGLFAADTSSMEEVAEKLKKLLDNLKIKHKRAIVSVSSYTSILKRISLDISPDQDLEEAILEEAEAHIPFDLDEVYLDYQILSSDEEKVDYILVAAKKDLIDTIIDFIKLAKIELIIIDIDALAITNIYTYLYQPEDCNLVIDLGASKTSMIIVNNNELITTRDLSIGTKQLDNEDEDKKLYNEERLIKGIEEAYNYFIETSNLEPKRIYITGGGSINKNLVKKIKQTLKKEISYFSIEPKIKIEKIEQNTKTYINHIGLTSVGLALREIVQ
ncbi:pilus assembly protein PilM [Thermodesulfatator atlanticus]|uniref:pilus assembly protein PilM n=1 Tax=Thermodesulfatator atlanticus TaxID=501497 RepID=UPI0003B6A4A4|nr:pilus assembly protein PilM [Thermodesulfatator atlanticus]